MAKSRPPQVTIAGVPPSRHDAEIIRVLFGFVNAATTIDNSFGWRIHAASFGRDEVVLRLRALPSAVVQSFRARYASQYSDVVCPPCDGSHCRTGVSAASCFTVIERLLRTLQVCHRTS